MQNKKLVDLLNKRCRYEVFSDNLSFYALDIMLDEVHLKDGKIDFILMPPNRLEEYNNLLEACGFEDARGTFEDISIIEVLGLDNIYSGCIPKNIIDYTTLISDLYSYLNSNEFKPRSLSRLIIND